MRTKNQRSEEYHNAICLIGFVFILSICIMGTRTFAAEGNSSRKASHSVDLTKIERRIQSEPDYESATQEYGLLVFGEKPTTQIWVVRDCDVFYVDRNANGVIGEKGEKREINSRDGESIVWETNVTDKWAKGNVSVGYRSDGGYEIDFSPDIDRKGLPYLHGKYQSAGWEKSQRPRFSYSPTKAPIVHFNGPLRFRGRNESFLVFKGSEKERQQSFRLVIGTPGLGDHTFVAYLIDRKRDIPDSIRAHFEFPSTGPAKGPIKQSVKLKTKPEG